MSSNITNALINKVKNRKVLRKGQIRGHLKSKYLLSIFVSLNLWVKIFIDSFIIKSNHHSTNKNSPKMGLNVILIGLCINSLTYQKINGKQIKYIKIP